MLSEAEARVLKNVNQHPSNIYQDFADSTLVELMQRFLAWAKVASVNCIRPNDDDLGAYTLNSPLSRLNIQSLLVHCLPLLSVCASPNVLGFTALC